uniref:Uncharacterized protein n=1 Tax=Arundo donax TaxID=35708 RepID=A0A0A8ZUH4_ARUDO
MTVPHFLKARIQSWWTVKKYYNSRKLALEL